MTNKIFYHYCHCITKILCQHPGFCSKSNQCKAFQKHFSSGAHRKKLYANKKNPPIKTFFSVGWDDLRTITCKSHKVLDEDGWAWTIEVRGRVTVLGKNMTFETFEDAKQKRINYLKFWVADSTTKLPLQPKHYQKELDKWNHFLKITTKSTTFDELKTKEEGYWKEKGGQ